MKTIAALLLIIAGIVLVDHFNLLQPSSRYPDPLNQLIKKVNPSQPLQKPAEEPTLVFESKQLYQWKTSEGVWQITDQPPEKVAYQTITLQGNKPDNLNETVESFDNLSPAPLTNQELKKASQCEFYLEQIDQYQSKMRFGGPGHIVDHWQHQIKWYQKLALQSCSD